MQQTKAQVAVKVHRAKNVHKIYLELECEDLPISDSMLIQTLYEYAYMLEQAVIPEAGYN